MTLRVLAVLAALLAPASAADKRPIPSDAALKEARDFEDVQHALAVLEREPTDAEANLTVGRHKCFNKSDWTSGVPMLALGSDEALKTLAVQELKEPTNSNEQVTLADGWYDLATESGEANKDRMLQRAGHWYQLSLQSDPALSRLVRGRVEKRLEELGPTDGSPPTGAVYSNTPQGNLRIFFDFPQEWKPSDQRTAVLLFHGGAWVSGAPDTLELQGQFFSNLGFVAGRVEYRIRSTHNTTPRNCVEDAMNAVKWLRVESKRYGVDPRRIVVFGSSAGGHLAACTGTLPTKAKATTSVPNAMILISPYVSLQRAVHFHTSKGFTKEMIATLSPIRYVSRNTPPTLVVVGGSESQVHVAQIKDYVKAARRAGARIEAHVVPGVKHGIDNTWTAGTQKAVEHFLAQLDKGNGEP